MSWSWILPVAAGGDRSLAAEQQHVMDCFHTGMRYEVHCGEKALRLKYSIFNESLSYSTRLSYEDSDSLWPFPSQCAV